MFGEPTAPIPDLFEEKGNKLERQIPGSTSEKGGVAKDWSEFFGGVEDRGRIKIEDYNKEKYLYVYKQLKDDIHDWLDELDSPTKFNQVFDNVFNDKKVIQLRDDEGLMMSTDGGTVPLVEYVLANELVLQASINAENNFNEKEKHQLAEYFCNESKNIFRFHQVDNPIVATILTCALRLDEQVAFEGVVDYLRSVTEAEDKNKAVEHVEYIHDLVFDNVREVIASKIRENVDLYWEKLYYESGMVFEGDQASFESFTEWWHLLSKSERQGVIRDLSWQMANTEVNRLTTDEPETYQELYKTYDYHGLESYDRGILTYGALDDHMKRVHSAICNEVSSKKLNDLKGAALMLSKTLSYSSEGTLDAYIEAFGALGSDIAFPYLIENLKSDDLLTRRMSAEILYSLELKSLRVSPDGVQYFNKVYKLVDEQDPNFWSNYYRELLVSAEGDVKNGEFEIRNRIRLLDEEGKVGIFGEKGLLGYFKLKLEGGSEHINTNVTYLAAKDFFLEKADEKPEDRLLREVMLHTLLEDYAEVREEVEARSGLKLHALKLHEQGWFIAFWTDKKTTPDEKERVIRMAKKYGTDGIKAFLALDYGEAAEEIISFMESKDLNEDDKKAIMHSYAHLSDRSMEWRKTLDAIEKGQDFKFSAEVHEAMIRKSTEFLRQAILIKDDETRVEDLNKLIKGMQRITETMEVCSGLYGDSKRLVLQAAENNSGVSRYWRFHDTKSSAQLKVSIRTEMERDAGRGIDVVERINITMQPDRGGNKNKRQKEEVSIRFDLDRVRGIKILSMDWGFGRKMIGGEHPTAVVGNMIADTAEEGGHVSFSFRPETSEHFPDVTKQLWQYMDDRYLGTSPVV